jgi:hypothetical protein
LTYNLFTTPLAGAETTVTPVHPLIPWQSGERDIQLMQLGFRCLHAQVLLLLRTDPNAGRCLFFIGIARHQLHIHKGGFPGLSKRWPGIMGSYQ